MSYFGFKSILLRTDHVELVVLPELGGKVYSLRHVKSGREWLWHNPAIPLRLPDGSGDYVGRYDSGGWDECFPGVDPCPAREGPTPSRRVGDHGEAWEHEWRVVEESSEGSAVRLVMEISSRGIPIRLRRTLDLEKHRPVLRVHYTAENLGAAQESFLWAAHPLIAIEGGMSLVLPAGTQLVRSYATENCPIHVASDLAVLTDPLEGGSQSFALKAHAFLPATDRWAALRTAAGEELRVEFDSSEITCLAIWLNARAWSGCGSEPYFNLGFEPMIGAVDRLDVAVEKNLERGLLAPHGSSTWSFTLRLK